MNPAAAEPTIGWSAGAARAPDAGALPAVAAGPNEDKNRYEGKTAGKDTIDS